MRLPAPYYADEAVTLYHGDARELLARLAPVEAVITDPVWPNVLPSLTGADDPWGLFAAAAEHFPRLAPRVIIHLGIGSDPRFLAAVPAALPFVSAVWLPWTPQARRGGRKVDADVAYLFGSSKPTSAGLLTGDGPRAAAGWSTQINGMPRRRAEEHPCPRAPTHVRWLVERFTERGERVLDPFTGEGTTLIEAKRAGRRAVGIEIEERWCRRAADLCARTPVQQVLALGGPRRPQRRLPMGARR